MNCHITPEHALKIFDEAGGILDIDDKCPLAVSATDLANTINAALDQVLGEPVGVTGEMQGTNGSFTMAAFKSVDVPNNTKLYAPKEQS